jgi:uncharacterized protein YukE
VNVYRQSPETEALLTELARLQQEAGDAATAFTASPTKSHADMMALAQLFERNSKRTREIQNELQQYRLG